MDVPEPPRAVAAESAWLRVARKLQEFVVAMLVYNVLPLLPLAVEWVRFGQVQEANLVLASAMFATTIGFASRNVLVFAVGAGGGLFMAMLTAEVTPNAHQAMHLRSAAIGILAIITLFHTAERIFRHVRRSEPALLFTGREGDR
jgi:hypothetical protein